MQRVAGAGGLGHPVLAVCDRAWQECSAVPGLENPVHWGIEDPAEAQGSEEERLAVFRRVRGDIGNRLHMFILAAGRPYVAAPVGASVARWLAIFSDVHSSLPAVEAVLADIASVGVDDRCR